jgi:hypothetical protein
MIKKYKLFFESFSISKDFNSYEEAYENFEESLMDVMEIIKSKGLNVALTNYSNAAQSNRNYDPEYDFGIVDGYMSKMGWTMNNVRKLMANVPNFLDKADRTGARLASGAGDYYFYKITNGRYPLQGYEWSFDEDAPYEENEYLIRFSYGWHTTKYGRLVIEQNLGSISNFIKICRQNIPETIVNMIVSKIYDTTISREINKNNNYIVAYDNEFYLDSESLMTDMSKYTKFLSSVDPKSTNNSFSQKEFDEAVYNACKSFGYECKIMSPGDIKIWIPT